MRFFLNAVFLFAGSCCAPYMGKDVCGADEFVLDSYKIREGKAAILEMQGKAFQDLDPALLEEHPMWDGGACGRTVQVAGVVEVPQIAINGKTRLFDVLAKARICSEANLFKSYVVRGQKLLSVDFFKLLKEGDMSQNIVMQPEDKIYIAPSSDTTVMIMGEVGRERVIHIPYGFISLREALAEACGIRYTGNKGCIQIIRGSMACPKIYAVSWEHVIHLPNDSLLLMPGDIVYVGTKPIAEWHRFISQLLPSLIETSGKSCCGS